MSVSGSTSINCKNSHFQKHRNIFPLLTRETMRPRHWAILRKRLGLQVIERSDLSNENPRTNQKQDVKPFLMKEVYSALMKMLEQFVLVSSSQKKRMKLKTH